MHHYVEYVGPPKVEIPADLLFPPALTPQERKRANRLKVERRQELRVLKGLTHDWQLVAWVAIRSGCCLPTTKKSLERLAARGQVAQRVGKAASNGKLAAWYRRTA
jgi:hypothetical protein